MGHECKCGRSMCEHQYVPLVINMELRYEGEILHTAINVKDNYQLWDYFGTNGKAMDFGYPVKHEVGTDRLQTAINPKFCCTGYWVGLDDMAVEFLQRKAQRLLDDERKAYTGKRFYAGFGSRIWQTTYNFLLICNDEYKSYHINFFPNKALRDYLVGGKHPESKLIDFSKRITLDRDAGSISYYNIAGAKKTKFLPRWTTNKGNEGVTSGINNLIEDFDKLEAQSDD